MDFEMYMESEIPGYKSLLAQSSIDYLKGLYDEVKSWEKVVNDTRDKMFNHNTSGIDYTTDWEKNLTSKVKASETFKEAIKQVKQELGIKEEKASVK